MTAPAIVTRRQWGATADLGPAMRLPAIGVFFHHSVTIAHDDDSILEPTDDPAADMRTIEAIGIERFGRFSYSYAIHPNGTILEGAGRTIGAHTADHNSRYFGIVFIGNLSTSPLTASAEAAAIDLLRHKIEAGELVPGWSLFGHRDQKATACPGDNVYRRLQSIHQSATNPEGDDMYTETDRKRDEATAAKVDDIHDIARQIAADYLTVGEGVRQTFAIIEQRTGDLVTGKRPVKPAAPAAKKAAPAKKAAGKPAAK